MSSGEFFFDGVASGYYTLRVMDSHGKPLAEQTVDPVNINSEVTIRLPESRGDKPASGSVSLAELQHKVPPKAFKEARKADNALQKNDLNGLIAHLEKALEIDPEFFSVRRNLAKALLMTKQYEKALPVLERLSQTEPNSVLAYDGLASVYLNTRRFPEAEAFARRALQLDASNELGHWVLGCSLSALGKSDGEALKHLVRIFKRFPTAHIVAAGIFAREGRKDEAKKELQAYIDTGDQGSRAVAQSWLMKLH